MAAKSKIGLFTI